jgi:hypothetical protein
VVRILDFSETILPLALLRVRQFRSHSNEPLLSGDFRADLEAPSLTAAERSTSIERLLYARRIQTATGRAPSAFESRDH